eukprot:2753798-Amphidinium_carterae.1
MGMSGSTFGAGNLTRGQASSLSRRFGPTRSPKRSNRFGNFLPKEVVNKRFVRDALTNTQVGHHIRFLVALEVFHGDPAVNNGLLSLVRFNPVQLSVLGEDKTSSSFEISVPPLGCLWPLWSAWRALSEDYILLRQRQPDTFSRVGHIANSTSSRVGVAAVLTRPLRPDGVHTLPQNHGRFMRWQWHRRRRRQKVFKPMKAHARRGLLRMSRQSTLTEQLYANEDNGELCALSSPQLHHT